MFATRGPLRDGDPAQIGDIQIQSRLGAGGMGVVYEGRTKEGRPVAVKVLRNGDWTSPESRATLTREARAIGSINSPHVAELLASDVDSEYPYLVLELVEGQPLNKAVPDGGFDTETATVIARQILEGLNAAHEAGVFLQDLKPSNVVLSDAGVKLIDFGVAAIADPGTQTSLTLGTSGEGSGTMTWLAPEQIRGAPGSEKSDVFAWGMVADYAATGRNPFGSGRPEAVMYSIVNDEPDLGRVDRQLGDAILAALNKDPDTRPTTNQIQATIGGSAARQTTSRTATPVPVPTGEPVQGPQPGQQQTANEPSPAHPARRRLVTIAVVVAVLIGIGAWQVLGPETVGIQDSSGPSSGGALESSEDRTVNPSSDQTATNAPALSGTWRGTMMGGQYTFTLTLEESPRGVLTGRMYQRSTSSGNDGTETVKGTLEDTTMYLEGVSWSSDTPPTWLLDTFEIELISNDDLVGGYTCYGCDGWYNLQGREIT